MRGRGVPINDLYGFALQRLHEIQHPQDVHFSDAGSAVIGVRVAVVIKDMLKQREGSKL